MVKNIIKIVYNRGMSAKLLKHFHERNNSVEILQNISLSILAQVAKGKRNKEQGENLKDIKRKIKELMKNGKDS